MPKKIFTQELKGTRTLSDRPKSTVGCSVNGGGGGGGGGEGEEGRGGERGGGGEEDCAQKPWHMAFLCSCSNNMVHTLLENQISLTNHLKDVFKKCVNYENNTVEVASLVYQVTGYMCCSQYVCLKFVLNPCNCSSCWMSCFRFTNLLC